MEEEKLLKKLKNNHIIRNINNKWVLIYLKREKRKFNILPSINIFKFVEIEKGEISGNIIEKLINSRYLQKFNGIDYSIDTIDNENFDINYYFCSECGAGITMKSSDMCHFILMDYKWRCSNESCINNKCPENTYDDDKPDWVIRNEI